MKKKQKFDIVAFVLYLVAMSMMALIDPWLIPAIIIWQASVNIENRHK